MAVDILGSLLETSGGNSCILVAEDYLEAWPIPNQKIKTIAKKLYMKCSFVFHYQIKFQGCQFDSGVMQELCKLLQIEKSTVPPT